MSLRLPTPTSRLSSLFAILAATSLLAVGCNGGGGAAPAGTGGGAKTVQFLTLGSAPIGGTFNSVGNAIANVLDTAKAENNWKKAQAKATKGSKQNIRMLDEGTLQLGMSNSAISYYAARGEGGFEKKFEIRAVVTMAPNVGLFIAKEGSGINSIADLKGKRITVGPAGAGFELFLEPLLKGHGVTYDDFQPLNVPYMPAAQQLGDGACDASFMGGATPIPAVTQACSSHSISFIPFDPEIRKKLIDEYPFFQPATISALNHEGKPTYRGLDTDFDAINVGSMHVITHASVDDELVYQLTKTIWENRAAIAKQHGAGRTINESNAARYTGTEFHPGAIRFYEEIGIWKGEADSPADSEGDTKAPEANEGDAKAPEAKEGDAKAPEAKEGDAKAPEAKEGDAKDPAK